MARQISLRLPEDLWKRIEREARKRRLGRSDLIRDVLAVHLGRGSARPSDRPYDRVRDLIGSLSGGPPDLGSRHRAYLRDIIRDRR